MRAADLRTLQLLTAGAQALAEGAAREALALLAGVPPGTQADADVLFLRGLAHLELDEALAARAELSRAAVLRPDDVATLCVLARACQASGELDAAIAALRRAAGLEPHDAHLHTLLGHLLLEAEDFGGAWETLLLAVELDPAEVDAHRGLALIFSAAGDAEHAQLAWRTAVSLQPDNALLHAGLAGALRDGERDAAALASYQRAAELRPDDAVLLANIASTLARLDRTLEARDAYERALVLGVPAGRQGAIVHGNFAALLERLGDLEGAREEYAAALDEDPGFWVAAEALGLMALDAGADAEACARFAQALDAGGLTAEALLHLTLLLEEFGRHEEARLCAGLLAAADTGDAGIAFRHAQLRVLSRAADVRDPPAAIATLRALLPGLRPEDSGPVWSLLGEALAAQGALQSAYEAASRALAVTADEHPAHARFQALREEYRSGLVGR